MSIYRDECGDRWLKCDACRPEYARKFYGIGLDSARLVRQIAKDLEGWARRKLILRFEPLEARWMDLCPACKQPEVRSMRLIYLAKSESAS